MSLDYIPLDPFEADYAGVHGETSRQAPLKSGYLVTTRNRTLTRRGVLWLGQTCNLRCFFCYFLERITDNEHPEHPFMTLDKAKEICRILREFYGNTAIDIQGGEPTIYPEILELIRYCREIGLYPTLITNAIRLAKPGVLEEFRDAGIRDFLVSFHGVGETHDEVVGRKGAYDKLITGVRRMKELGIPFRFNCTMTKPVVPLIPAVARKAIEFGALAVNYIVFNCYEDPGEHDPREANEARYSTIKPYLTEAIDMLEANGVEVNVRYLPLCMVEKRHRKNVYNYQQLSYDHHEWDYQSWMWTGLQPQRMKEGKVVPPFRIGYSDRRFMARHLQFRAFYERWPLLGRMLFEAQGALALLDQACHGKDAVWRREAMRRPVDGRYRYAAQCAQCAARSICDGFHGDYAMQFGVDEAAPITDIPPTDDPTVFIRGQDKFVEDEDREWAL